MRISLPALVAADLDPLYIVIQAETSDFHLEGAIANFECVVNRPLVLRMVAIILPIPAAHRVNRDSITYGSEHFIDGEASRLAEDIPNSDVNKRHSELSNPLNTLILKCTPQIGADLFGKRRVLPKKNRFDFRQAARTPGRFCEPIAVPESRVISGMDERTSSQANKKLAIISSYIA
jgi:hypothetical protein